MKRFGGVAALFCGIACMAYANVADIIADCKDSCSNIAAFERAGAAANKASAVEACQNDYNNSDHGPEAELAKTKCINDANTIYEGDLNGINEQETSCKASCDLIS